MVLLFSGIVSVGVLPGIIGGIILLILSNYFHKLFIKKELVLISIITVLFAILYGSIYVLFGNKNASSYGTSSISNNVLNAFNLANFKKISFFIIFPILRTLIYYLPLILFILFAYFKTKLVINQRYFILIILLMLFVLFSGSVAGGLSFNILSGGQFYTIWILNILIIFLFIHYFKDLSFNCLFKSRRNIFIIFGILITLLYNAYNTIRQNESSKESLSNLIQYSDKYLIKVTDYLDNAKINPYGVILASNNEIHQYPFKLGEDLLGLGSTGTSIKFSSKNYYFASNLSIFEINQTDTTEVWEKDFLKILNFYSYVQNEKKNNKFESISKSQLKFIRDNKIDFIIKYKNALLPNELKSRIKFQITDSLSGESFIVLNEN